MPRRLTNIAMCAALLFCGAAHALDFRSVQDSGTIFYAAPNQSSARLFVVSQYYPVEVLATENEWSHVRDVAGQFAWVPTAKLMAKRYVVVISDRAVMRDSPSANAASVAILAKDVALELLAPPTSSWVKVRHEGKTAGFIRLQDLWGI